MKVDITYPHVEKKKLQRQGLIHLARWPFVLSALIVVIVNIATGGPTWSIMTLWSLWMVWSFLISPDLVEANRISIWIRLITSTSILLLIIDMTFPTGWSIEVVSNVCFCGLMIAGVLFFTDLDRQRQNMMPMMMLTAISLLASVIGLALWKEESRWALIVLGAVAVTLLALCVIALGRGFVPEVKKRFHTR